MSKKLKNIDDSIFTEETRMTKLWNKWLIWQRKAITQIKTQLKKTPIAKKKIVEKQEKAKAKNHILEIRQLTLFNRQTKPRIRSFKDILLDLSISDKYFQPFNNKCFAKNLQPPSTYISHIATKLKNVQKKEITNHLFSD